MRLIWWIALTCSYSVTLRAESLPSCQSIQFYRQVIGCALENDPDVVLSQDASTQADFLDALARQRPNPDLAAKSIYGSSSGERISTTDVDLLHTFELGGKRDARIKQAESQKQLLAVDVEKSKAEVAVKVVRSLYQLRQLNDEAAILSESLDAFKRIQRSYKNRPRLSPEQESSLGVFQLAEGDAELQLVTINSRIHQLERELSLAAGGKVRSSPGILPPTKSSWPTIQMSIPESGFGGADIKFAVANLGAAQTQLESAKSASWPDLKLGPSWERDKTGGLVTNAFGLSLVVPLPLYQANAAGRSYAAAGLERAQREVSIRRSSLKVERDILVERYSDSVGALSKALDLKALNKKHSSLEGHFERGLVPSQLVIEAHRQLLDFVKSKNEHELNAIEALVRIRAIEGASLTGDL